MSTFERFDELPSGFELAKRIPVPYEADQAWCAMITKEYGGRFRTKIEAEWVLRDIFNPHGNSAMKSYERVECLPINGEPPKLNGLVIGAKLAPEFADGPYRPYLTLIDVDQDESPCWIAQSSEQEFLVPLDKTDEITIFPDHY